ncbi:ATP-binding protein [Aggregatilinea lenta]|uniref:ATP-binding protein n=1 Tax=Aggregatilinea lenta TaxID=913108 RepID=UPI0013C335CC|nr:ATP-binding protein [Aggregatilinea lenta]
MTRNSPPELTFTPQPPGPPVQRARYLSIRWQIIFPVFLVVLAVSMLGAYVTADRLASEAADADARHLTRARTAVQTRADALLAAQDREALRAAFTGGVPDALAAHDATTLHDVLEPLAAAGDLDTLIVAGADGQEALGLQRSLNAQGAADYAVSTGAHLAEVPVVAVALAGGTASGWLSSGESVALVTAVPVMANGDVVGVVLVGTQLDGVLAALRGGDGIELALAGPDGAIWAATRASGADLAAALPPDWLETAWERAGDAPVSPLDLAGASYHVVSAPLNAQGTSLGMLVLYRADEAATLLRVSRPVLGVTAALLAALVVVIGFVVVGSFIARLDRIVEMADAFGGDDRMRTGMAARDEIGAVGAAFDRLAERVQRRTQTLERQLQTQRQEASRLTSILEAIPDGLVVQDLDGRVILMNDAARKLLGGQRAYRAARLHDLASVVAETLGPALAPGIYALGDPTQVPLEGRMLHVQAAAIVTGKQERLGTVIVVRDMTTQIVVERTRDDLLAELEEQARPAPQSYDSLATLAREVATNTRSLQRVITELRDLSTFEPRDLRAGQRPLELNALLRQVGAEWQPHAKTAGLRFHVDFGDPDWHVLGDERRLRWAIGNVIDNAIKYSLPGGLVHVAARADEDDSARVQIMVEDAGCGMSPRDLAQAFTRFFRGIPRDPTGHPVRKPGTGQGLFIARRVIEAHAGQIALSSELGRGTTAVITLSLTSPQPYALPGRDDRAVPERPLSSGDAYDTVPLEPGEADGERQA